MKGFALIGVSGFVAPRHLRAIKETGNQLIAALDPSDAAGILDQYFPHSDFYTTEEEFDNFLAAYKKSKGSIDFISVCSPNHLHEQHVSLGLKHGTSVICEKPLVLHPGKVHWLYRLQQQTGKEVYNILQLRLHPQIITLKKRIDTVDASRKHELELSYITPRGKWYHASWKGDEERSGGIATNIGIHFFDMLLWIFGKVQRTEVHLYGKDRAAGFLELEKARVRWYLSIRESDLPPKVRSNGEHAYRYLTLNGDRIEFSGGFEDLHQKSYEAILAGAGFPLMEALPSIELVHEIRTATPVGNKGEVHPMARV